MATLQAAMNAQAEEKKCLAKSSQKHQHRLLADHAVSVQEIQSVYNLHVAFKGNKKLYELVCPGEQGPRLLSWNTRPNGTYMAKMSGLVFDLLELAPNTKLLSSRNLAAILALVGNGTVINNVKVNNEPLSVQCCIQN